MENFSHATVENNNLYFYCFKMSSHIGVHELHITIRIHLPCKSFDGEGLNDGASGLLIGYESLLNRFYVVIATTTRFAPLREKGTVSNGSSRNIRDRCSPPTVSPAWSPPSNLRRGGTVHWLGLTSCCSNTLSSANRAGIHRQGTFSCLI